MKLTERQETTDYAVEKILLNLEGEEYFPALLLSFIYASIRLRSLVADYLRPTNKTWKRTHEFLSIPAFSQLPRYANENKVVTKRQYRGLDKLRKIRNKIAHESTPWRHPKPDDTNRMIASCHFAISFLKDTSD